MGVKLDSDAVAFETFVRSDGDRLRKALTSRYGVDVGCDSTDAALAWAWENWERLAAMANPTGYLYRVAQTQANRAIKRGRRVSLPPEPPGERGPDSSHVDGDLADALLALSEQQRSAVLLVHVHGWSPTEVAQLTGVPAATVRSHLRRGLRQLRNSLQKGHV